jgi:hypothetical protein
MSNDLVKKKLIKLNERETFLEIDLKDKLIQDLLVFGGRINALLINPNIEKNKNAVTLLDDLLEAVYSLIFSEHNQFEDRTDKQIEEDKVNKRASQIEKGVIRIDGKWIAGWHFNSALHRISSVYHRILKIIVDDKDNKSVSDLFHLVDKKHNEWTGKDWLSKNTRRIYAQVNKFKHNSEGIFLKRTATRQDAKYSINELLNLIEKWSNLIQTT